MDCGVIRTSSANGSFSDRLAIIFNELSLVLARHQPDEAAAEQVFTAKNAASALKLGQARGAAVAACAGQGLRVFDYEPTLVKKSLTGAGRADKEQVRFMIGKLLGSPVQDFALDTTDALAVAICHLSFRRYNKLQEL